MKTIQYPVRKIKLSICVYNLLAWLLWSVASYGQQQGAQPAAPKQMIQNGGMEENPAKTWSFGFFKNQTNNPNGYKFGRSFEAAASGEYSYRISCSAIRSDSAHCFLYQSFSTAGIPVGAKLTLKAKIKTVGLEGKGVSLALRGDKNVDGQGAIVFFLTSEGKDHIGGTHEFEEYTYTVNSFPGNMDYMALLMMYLPGTTGTVYLDDVSLTVN
jgi:hypothetical protein